MALFTIIWSTALRLGAGVGAQVLLASFSRTPDIYGYGGTNGKTFITNHYYKTVLPVVPLNYRADSPKW